MLLQETNKELIDTNKLEVQALNDELEAITNESYEAHNKLALIEDELDEYKDLITTIAGEEDELLSQRVSATLNGTKVIPILKLFDTEPKASGIMDFRMLTELDASIIYTYYKNWDTLVIGELHKTELTVLNEIAIPLESNNARIMVIPRIIDDGIAVLKADSIDIYSLQLVKTNTLTLPNVMLDHYSNARTRAIDGRESINMYDVSDDLKQLVYCDQSGVYLYNRLSKIETRIMEPRDDNYINEVGETINYKTVHLHPKFYEGFVISEIHDFYAGYLRFHLYNLKTKVHTIKEIGGSQYGYHEAQGPNFTIYSSENFNNSYFGHEEDYYKHTFIYNPVNDNLMYHPISQDWMNSVQEQWGFDGANGSTYLVNPHGIKGYDSNLETRELTAFYYDYKSETYLDKHVVFNTGMAISDIEPTWGDRQAYTLVGTLEDNTALYLILDQYNYYVFRF